jgi:UDP-N-acetylglucosamine 3-dehydrogenase
MYKVGIVGVGGMGRVHARQYRKRNDVDLQFYDRNADRSKSFRDVYGAAPASSFDELLKQVDVIDVCLPTPEHREYGLKAIAAGRAVLMEKPLALNLNQAEELASAAAKADVPLMPAHVARYFPEYRIAHDMVVRGDIGKPAAARLRRGGGAPSGSDKWFMDCAKSGLTLLDLSIHDFDWLHWTLGPVKFLYSRSVGQKTGRGPDYSLTTLTFENGCIAHVEGTWMDPSGFRTHFEIAGSDGLIQHDSRLNSAVRTSLAPRSTEGAPLPNLEGGLFEIEDPYYLEIDGFLKAVSAAIEPPVSVRDGLMAVSIAEAATQSARTNEVITPASQF